MKEERETVRERTVSDEELASVVGGAQEVEIARCARCRRGCAPAAMYAFKGEKYCPACYREMLKG